MGINNNNRIDVSLDNEEIFKIYGRKKTVSFMTLG